MSIPKVVSTFYSLPSELLQRLHDNGIIRLVTPPSPNSRGPELKAWLQENAKGASALIVWVLTGYIGKEYLDIAGGSLRVVSSFSVGYDHIDVDTFNSHGVRIGTTPNVSDDSVADSTLLLLLMIQRRALEQAIEPKAGRWMDCVIGTASDPTFMNGSTIRGKTVAFYGFGRIAQKVAERILPLGPARIVYKTSKQHAPFTASAYPSLHLLTSTCYTSCRIENRPDSIESLVEGADVVICLTTLNAQTKGTINSKTLASFKKGAFLLNVGRGPVIDNDALVDALRSGHLGGVALDVLDGEPFIGADHPLLAPDMASKVVLFPHHGSAEIDARKAMAELVARNVFHGLGLTKDALKVIEDVEQRQVIEELIDGPIHLV